MQQTQDDIIIGLDAGTSVLKAVAFLPTGEEVAQASTPNHVMQGAHGAAEQDMDRTWLDTAATLHQLAGRVPDLARRTRALAITAQGDGTWLIDAQGRPTGPALLWLDGRSSGQVQALRASPGYAELVQITGTALNPAMQSAQLLWLRQQKDARLERAAAALHCKDWLHYCLTGQLLADPCEGVFTFGNWKSRNHDARALEILGLQDCRSLLPPIVDGIHTTPLSAQAARACGLLAATPVLLPLLDVTATVLGGGGVAFADDGSLARVGCSVLGSTGMHGWVSDCAADIRPGPDAGYTMPMPLPGAQARLMSHMAATLNVDWLLGWVCEAAQLAGGSAPDAGELLQRLGPLVLQAPPAQAIFHPYVAESGERGPFVDGDARAVLSGFGSSLGLAGMARAVLEGICLAARHCYAALGELPAEIRLTGGAARSHVLRQMLASVTRRPVRASRRQECGAAGAALCAAVACGFYPSVRAALPDWSERWLEASATLPDAGHAALYEGVFALYQRISAQQRDIWPELARLRSQTPCMP